MTWRISFSSQRKLGHVCNQTHTFSLSASEAIIALDFKIAQLNRTRAGF